MFLFEIFDFEKTHTISKCLIHLLHGIRLQGVLIIKNIVEAPASKWPIFNGQVMASADFVVASSV